MVSSQLSLVKDIFALGQISRGTVEVHVCVAEVLSVCASLVIWRAGAQRHFRFSHIHGTPYLYPRLGAVAVLWKSQETSLLPREETSSRHGHGGQKTRADYSLCGSLGDASVNARAMSRRKQGNPQHLSQREIITRKSILCFTYYYLCLGGCLAIFF